MVGHGHGFAKALGFVINRAWADGIDVSPIGFFLRMLQRIAVAFRGGRRQIFRPVFTSHIQSMKRTPRSHLQGFDSMFGVIDRAGGASKMKYIIHLAAIEWLINVDLLKFKSRVSTQVIDVGKTSGEQIIDGDNRVAFGQQCIAQMRAQKTGCPGDQCSHRRRPPPATLARRGAPVNDGAGVDSRSALPPSARRREPHGPEAEQLRRDRHRRPCREPAREHRPRDRAAVDDLVQLVAAAVRALDDEDRLAVAHDFFPRGLSRSRLRLVAAVADALLQMRHCRYLEPSGRDPTRVFRSSYA